MKKSNITIVIPAYNEASRIARCLDSCVNQTQPPREIIVVDNNCTDDTIKIAARYPTVRVVREKKQGIAPARTKGFNEVKTLLIGRIDADTILAPNWVETAEKYFAKHPEVIMIGGRAGMQEFSSSTRIRGVWLQAILSYFDNQRYAGRHHIYAHNMVLRTTAWKKIRNKLDNASNLEVLEDLDISLWLSTVGSTEIYTKLRVTVPLIRALDIKKSLLYQRTARKTYQRFLAAQEMDQS